jgi:hypothetical protein
LTANTGQSKKRTKRTVSALMAAATLGVAVTAWLIPDPLTEVIHAAKIFPSTAPDAESKSTSTTVMPIMRINFTSRGSGYVFTFSGPVETANQGGTIRMEAVCPAQPDKGIDERRYRSSPASIDNNVWTVRWPTTQPLGECTVEAILLR